MHWLEQSVRCEASWNSVEFSEAAEIEGRLEHDAYRVEIAQGQFAYTTW
jgi:hypothetical protein